MQAKVSAIVVPVEHITSAILVLRGHKVLLDSELAALYGVATKRFNEQAKRNAKRFPGDFLFRLTAAEVPSGMRLHKIGPGKRIHPAPAKAGRAAKPIAQSSPRGRHAQGRRRLKSDEPLGAELPCPGAVIRAHSCPPS